MIAMQRREAVTVEIPDMSAEQIEREWHQAKESFDQALLQKTECDRIYAAAAVRLNTIDRLMKKVEQRAALARREAAKALANSQAVSTRPRK